MHARNIIGKRLRVISAKSLGQLVAKPMACSNPQTEIKKNGIYIIGRMRTAFNSLAGGFLS